MLARKLLAKKGFVRMVSNVAAYKYDTLNVTSPHHHVLHVQQNRPDKRNAMNQQFFVDMRVCFGKIKDDPGVRCVVFSGAGPLFTAGLDLMSFMPLLMPQEDQDVGRRALQLRSMITAMQESFNVMENCDQPVIACVHSACVGGGIDMICACDIRLATKDSWYTIKEVDIGLAADLGTLQRLPKIIGNDSLARELAYTARNMYANEALSSGLVSRLYDTKDDMITHAFELAKTIASKSPVAIAAIKHNLNFSRDHGVQEGLDHMVACNMGLLQSSDLVTAGQASTPTFPDLSSKL